MYFLRILEEPFVQDLLVDSKINVYIVGGMVRDSLLGVESQDYDIVIEGITDENLAARLERFGRIVPIIGRTFGVIKFMPDFSQITLDIALPRREWYEVGQRRKNAVVETKNVRILDDLARRDFTINAMAIDLRKMKELQIDSGHLEKIILDPFGGLKDLHDKIIRAVGLPDERFLEDPTRILRGIRFAIRFGFTIDAETLISMKRLHHEITKKFLTPLGNWSERVSFEMIGQEFIRTFGVNPVRTLDFYNETGLLKLFFPELENEKGIEQPPEFHEEGDVFTHTRLALSKLAQNASLTVKLAVLFHDVGKVYTFTPISKTRDRIRFNNHDVVGAEKAKEIMRRLRLPDHLIHDVSWLVRQHIKLSFSFPHMRLDKKKRFAREPLFPQLLELVCADALASIHKNQPKNCHFLKSARATLEIVEREKAEGVPTEIINGDDIIKLLKEIQPNFNSVEEGRKIGRIKQMVNSKYDLGEIKTKREAQLWVKKNLRSFG